MPDGRVRSALIRKLGGVTDADIDGERNAWKMEAEWARERAQDARDRLARHESAIATHLGSGSPIACPECGSTELFELQRQPNKVQVRCQNDHRSYWTGEGLPLVPFQEMLARVQREQVEPLRARFRAEREVANRWRQLNRVEEGTD